ncbi:MAG: aldehyde dehydrogenase family protein [Theionarchaea archaeon]|nr:aldehyde dehydrogenase family protein [Theionarchaea archaeon]
MYKLLIDDWIETERVESAIRADDFIKDPGVIIAYYLKNVPSYKKRLMNIFSSFFSPKTALEKFAFNYIKAHGIPEFYEDAVFARYCVASQKDVQKSIEVAWNHVEEVRSLSIDTRRDILSQIGKAFRENRTAIEEISVAEGHPQKMLEWEYTESSTFFTDEMLTNLGDQIQPKRLNGDYLLRVPFGTVGLVTPYNAATTLGILNICCSFIAGNSTVVKPPSMLPISTLFISKMMYDIFQDFDINPLCTTVADSKMCLNEWIQGLNCIIFYGSSEVGAQIASQAVKNYKKVVLEIAGSDATLIWEDATIQKATEDVGKARFLGSGQACISTKRLFVHEKVYDEVISGLTAYARSLHIGLPSDPRTDIVPTDIKALDAIERYCQDALEKGAHLECGGHRVNYKGERDDLGLYFEPTVLSACRTDMLCMQEETFGPLLPICKITSIEEAIDKINASRYGLRASVWAQNEDIIEAFIHKVDTGGVIINDDHMLFTAQLPHLGGVKASGISGSKYFNIELTYMKYVHRGH